MERLKRDEGNGGVRRSNERGGREREMKGEWKDEGKREG